MIVPENWKPQSRRTAAGEQAHDSTEASRILSIPTALGLLMALHTSCAMALPLRPLWPDSDPQALALATDLGGTPWWVAFYPQAP